MVVPYIGTWIETPYTHEHRQNRYVVPYIGTWIETFVDCVIQVILLRRTLYRYVD